MRTIADTQILSKEQREELKLLKDVYLSKKQGEALERSSTPKTDEEALSLGHYGPETNIILNLAISTELLINKLTGTEDLTISKMMLNISRASSNRSAKRLEKTLETVGMLGQYIPMMKSQKLPPEAVDLNG